MKAVTLAPPDWINPDSDVEAVTHANRLPAIATPQHYTHTSTGLCLSL